MDDGQFITNSSIDATVSGGWVRVGDTITVSGGITVGSSGLSGNTLLIENDIDAKPKENTPILAYEAGQTATVAENVFFWMSTSGGLYCFKPLTANKTYRFSGSYQLKY